MNNAELMIQANTFLSIISEAVRASDNAAECVTVQEMRVKDENGDFQGPYPICGSSSVIILKGNKNGYYTSEFAEFLLENFPHDKTAVFCASETWDKSGVSWIFLNGDQSYDRNRARAYAVSKVLAKYEIISSVETNLS